MPLATLTVPVLVKGTPSSVAVMPAPAWALKVPALLNVEGRAVAAHPESSRWSAALKVAPAALVKLAPPRG